MIALTLTDDYPDDDFPPFGSGWFSFPLVSVMRVSLRVTK